MFFASSRKKTKGSKEKKVFQTILYLILSNAFGMRHFVLFLSLARAENRPTLRGKGETSDFMASMEWREFPCKCPRFPFCVPRPLSSPNPFHPESSDQLKNRASSSLFSRFNKTFGLLWQRSWLSPVEQPPPLHDSFMSAKKSTIVPYLTFLCYVALDSRDVTLVLNIDLRTITLV